MKRNEQGFAHLMVLLLVVATAVVAVAGYEVVSKHNQTKADATTTSKAVSGTVTLAPLPDNLSNLITPEKLSQLIADTSTANAQLKDLNLHEVNGKPVFDATLSDGTRVAYDAQTGAKVTPSTNSNSGSSNVFIPVSELKQAMTVGSAKQLAAKQKAAILAAIQARKVAQYSEKASSSDEDNSSTAGSTTSGTGTGTPSSSSPTPSTTPSYDTVVSVDVQNVDGTPAYNFHFKDGTKLTLPIVRPNPSAPVSTPPCHGGPILQQDGMTYTVVAPSTLTGNKSVMMCPMGAQSTSTTSGASGTMKSTAEQQ